MFQRDAGCKRRCNVCDADGRLVRKVSKTCWAGLIHCSIMTATLWTFPAMSVCLYKRHVSGKCFMITKPYPQCWKPWNSWIPLSFCHFDLLWVSAWQRRWKLHPLCIYYVCWKIELLGKPVLNTQSTFLKRKTVVESSVLLVSRICWIHLNINTNHLLFPQTFRKKQQQGLRVFRIWYVLKLRTSVPKAYS